MSPNMNDNTTHDNLQITSPGEDAIMVSRNVHDLSSVLKSGSWSDLKIVCGDGKEFKVHKAIVCPQSSYFRAACTVPMKESSENVIRLPEFTAVVNAILEFCYSGSYLGEFNIHPGKNVLLTAQIYIAADKYDVSGLQDYIRPVLLGDLRYCEEELKPGEDVELGPEEGRAFRKSFSALFDAVHLLLEQSHGEDAVRTRLLGINWSLIAVEPYRNSWIQFFKTHPEYAVDVVTFQSQQDWQSQLLVIEDKIFGVVQEDGTPEEVQDDVYQ